MQFFLGLCTVITITLSVQGCVVYSVASAAVSITADVVSTGVNVVTGTVDMAVDAAAPSK